MDKKDLISLMEAYGNVILDKEIDVEPEIGMEHDDMGHEDMEHDDMGHDDMGGSEISQDDLESNEEEKEKMVCAHLHTIRSHAHEIYSCVENGANIEPWMEEKIAIANDYIVHVANAIMYRK